MKENLKLQLGCRKSILVEYVLWEEEGVQIIFEDGVKFGKSIQHQDSTQEKWQ